ncbi:hypothetical protein M1O54_06970 [Dehalococcoidia bacterium]|nr:hypothetical protein [Dehalococcoidia bacterium]
MLWHTLEWKKCDILSSRFKEAIRGFVRKVRKKNPENRIIIVLDNLKSHKAGEVIKEAERLAISLFSFPLIHLI